MVAWLALWLFGSDVGGCGGDVVDPKSRQENKNGYLKASQPDESHAFPLNNGGETYLYINLAA